ncbi:MAG: hypothetical protein M3014_04505 [Chloroflexota bacterium]|nr:hypothetical protein [Chloroflexota bacterium]
MNDFSLGPGVPVTHNVELYTARLFIQGNISGPFKRTSDLINRKDRGFFNVGGASITPLGQTTPPKQLQTTVMVGRPHIHFVATDPTLSAAQGGSLGAGREYVIQKLPVSCYALTDTFILYGTCYLHHDSTVESLVSAGEPFMPLTKVTIYLIARPAAPWQREFIVVNKEKLEVIYLLDSPIPGTVQP